MKGKRQSRRAVAKTGSKKRPAPSRARQKAQGGGSRLTPEAQWAIATRVYADLDAPSDRARAASWIDCAITAYRAGNPLHLPRVVSVCMDEGIAAPSWLHIALARYLPLAALGKPILTKGIDGKLLSTQRARLTRGGTHSRLLHFAAQKVLDVETLLHHEALRAALDPESQASAELRYTLPFLKGGKLGSRGRGVADRATVEYFDAGAVTFHFDQRTEIRHRRVLPPSDGGHVPRSNPRVDVAHRARAVTAQVNRARGLLRDARMRDFLSANFPPALLERLASSGKKHK